MRVSSGPSGQVGAIPGTFGLTGAPLTGRDPIEINGNSGWTGANGVRSGTGTSANPYVISDWSINMASYPTIGAGIRIHGNSTKFGVIRNVKVYNVNNDVSGGNYFAILIGTPAYPPSYSADRADNIVVTRSETHGKVYGIEASYGVNNVTISYNAVFINVTGNKDWQYGITCQGGTYYCTVVGNYVDARNAETGTATRRTVGIQLGDQPSKKAFPADPLHWRIASFPVARYNTVSNATGHGIISDQTYKGQVFGNLIYQNYPGRKSVFPPGEAQWTSRGVMIEYRANYTQIHDNDVSEYIRDIQPSAWAGWYWNNSVHNSDNGIYFPTNGSTPQTEFTDFNVVWNTKYSSNSLENIHVAANELTTILDVTGTPTTTYFPVSFTNQAGRTISNVKYDWTGTDLNISYALDAKGYMPLVLVYYHSPVASMNLMCQWYGSSTTISVSLFTSTNITFVPTYSGTASMGCTGVYWDKNVGTCYVLKRNWVVQEYLGEPGGFPPSIGIASFAGPFPATYAVRISGPPPCP